MAYADNKDKVRGIQKEEIVKDRVLQFLRSIGFIVEAMKASINEDM